MIKNSLTLSAHRRVDNCSDIVLRNQVTTHGVSYSQVITSVVLLVTSRGLVMMKYLFLLCTPLILVACATQDENYYRKNPQALQQAVKNCPNKSSSEVSCEQLMKLAENINELAYQLQINPQGFGKKILTLQENLAKQQADLQDNPNQPELRKMIEQNKQQLVERLAVVKWLESPES